MNQEALARALAERLNAVLPETLSLLVTDGFPPGDGSSGPWLTFTERGRVELQASVSNFYPNWLRDFLDQLQDCVAESIYEPWPATMTQARGRKEPFPNPILERTSHEVRLTFVYRETGEQILALPPIPLSELSDRSAQDRAVEWPEGLGGTE